MAVLDLMQKRNILCRRRGKRSEGEKAVGVVMVAKLAGGVWELQSTKTKYPFQVLQRTTVVAYNEFLGLFVKISLSYITIATSLKHSFCNTTVTLSLLLFGLTEK